MLNESELMTVSEKLIYCQTQQQQNHWIYLFHFTETFCDLNNQREQLKNNIEVQIKGDSLKHWDWEWSLKIKLKPNYETWEDPEIFQTVRDVSFWLRLKTTQEITFLMKSIKCSYTDETASELRSHFFEFGKL